MYINLEDYLGFFLIVMRMAGLLLLNPIFGRRNVPARVNAGLALFLGIMLYGAVPIPSFGDPTLLDLLLFVMVELAVGALAGLIMQMFLSVLVIAGDLIDMNIGIAMAKAFDPGTNASVALTASFLNALFILIFFVTNNHLTLIHMTVQTFRIIPLGSASVSPDALYYLPELMSSIFIFGIKLSLPIIIIEIVTTMGVGIIMRVVPQINVFVVNIQIKLLIGLLSLFFLVPAFTGFMESLITICFERIGEAWLLM